MEIWCKSLVKNLVSNESDGVLYSYHVEQNELNQFIPKITMRQHGIDRHYVLNEDFSDQVIMKN